MKAKGLIAISGLFFYGITSGLRLDPIGSGGDSMDKKTTYSN
jgi:hypothetical protein